jgi:hypothetical protein
MKQYIAELRAEAARLNGATEQSPRKRQADTRIQCEVPLTDQINALMRSLPPAQRDRPWSVAELVARLNGRFKARPSHGDVGVALRALGWTRTRDWSHDGGGRRVWTRHCLTPKLHPSQPI